MLLIGDISKTEMEEMEMVRGRNGGQAKSAEQNNRWHIARNIVARHVPSHKFRALGYGRRWTGNPSPMRRLKSWATRLGAL